MRPVVNRYCGPQQHGNASNDLRFVWALLEIWNPDRRQIQTMGTSRACWRSIICTNWDRIDGGGGVRARRQPGWLMVEALARPPPSTRKQPPPLSAARCPSKPTAQCRAEPIDRPATKKTTRVGGCSFWGQRKHGDPSANREILIGGCRVGVILRSTVIYGTAVPKFERRVCSNRIGLTLEYVYGPMTQKIK